MMLHIACPTEPESSVLVWSESAAAVAVREPLESVLLIGRLIVCFLAHSIAFILWEEAKSGLENHAQTGRQDITCPEARIAWVKDVTYLQGGLLTNVVQVRK